ncbi:unnamed protein product [Colias eurytheme]|nr:unnamed protein product [Colias eurytheme]
MRALLLESVFMMACRGGGTAVDAGARDGGRRRRGRGRTCSGNGVARTTHLLALSPFAAANGIACAATCYAQNKQRREETYRAVLRCKLVFIDFGRGDLLDFVIETNKD